MPNLTPDDIARGLKWCDTIDTDPLARHRLANLVVEHQRELLELAARGMRADLDLEEALRLNNEMMRHFDEACDLCERAQSERDQLRREAADLAALRRERDELVNLLVELGAAIINGGPSDDMSPCEEELEAYFEAIDKVKSKATELAKARKGGAK